MGTQGSSAPVPSMAYYQPGGALSYAQQTPSVPINYGLDPQTLAMLYGAPGPQSPYSKKLDEASGQILGDPSQIGGALSSAQERYNSGVQDKLAAINRAAAMISGTRGNANTPLMQFAAGLGSTPFFTEGMASGFGKAADEINKQRAAELAIAQGVGNLGVEGANTNINAALEDQASIEKRLQLSGQLENQAGNIQARSDLANARNRSSLLQYAGRIGVADINSNKNRWKFIGNDPNDPTIGQYEDQNAPPGRPVIVAGPPATGGGRAGAAQSRDAARRQMWLNVHPGDEAGALDFVAGHRALTPQEIRRSSYMDAERELGAGADPADIDARAKEIADSISGPAPAVSPPAGNKPPAGNQPPPKPSGNQPQPMTPAERAQSVANAKAAIARNPSARPEIIKRLQQAGIPTAGL